MSKSKKHTYNLRKQFLRGKMSMAASYTEIYVTILILIGIVMLSFSIFHDLYLIGNDLLHGTDLIQINDFLSTAFELIIGIEFIKMLAKHTPSSAVEVILYAVARQLINNHETMLDSLIGVLAIAILFAVRKYLSETIHRSKEDEFIVDGSITIDELNDKMGSHVDRSLGNTIAGILFNSASKDGIKLKEGYNVSTSGYVFEIYSMDRGLIQQVKIIEEKI